MSNTQSPDRPGRPFATLAIGLAFYVLSSALMVWLLCWCIGIDPLELVAGGAE